MANPLLDALLADREGNSASGFSPMSAPMPAAGARIIDFNTPLPEMSPDAASSEDTLAFPEEVDQTYMPLDTPEPVEPANEMVAPSTANPLLAALQADQALAAEAATQQAVAEATAPTENLPVLKSDLANALGVLDYRDPEEGARRQQAAAMGEILGLPEYEKVQLGAAPVNPDGTVTIRRAQAVSPEAQAAADAQMEIIRRDAAAEMNPPNRAVEALNRAERGARLGVEDVRSGFYSIVEDFFRPQQNPYLEKSQAAAIEDVPKLESRLADLQSRQAEFTKGDLGPNRDRISPFDDEISTLQNQLAKARQATTGEPVTENFLGNLSRASGDLAAEARENQQTIAAEYTPAQIRPERDKEFWMTVADSLGRSAPTAAGAVLNPYLGLTLGYTQVFSNAESEFDQAAAQTGKPIDPEARAEYAHSQAVLQTPFELVGDIALAKVARDSVAASGKALMQAVRVGDSGAVTSFVSNLPRRAGQLAAAAAGETLITTPAQTVIEQKLAEAEGIRSPISNAELAARTSQAMQVAGAQSLLLGGGPVALETGVTTIADGIAARRQAPTTPAPAAPAEVPQNFTPISTPAAAPATARPRSLGEVRAPQIAVDQAAIDEAFGSPFAPPPAVNPQVNPAEDSTFAPPANGTPPAASAPVASAPIAPEPTGSPELIAGEGAFVPVQPAPIQSLVDVGEQGNIKGIKPQVAATAAEYEQTYPLTERKREIKNAGYPPEQVEQFVAQNYKPSKFATLLEPHRGNIVFLEAPSTSRSNTIPLVFANKLATDFDGSVLRGDQFAAAQAKAEAKDKSSYISKMEDPSRFTITDPDLASKLAGKFVVLVDDFVTSGETLDGLTESLTASGIKPQGIVAIGAAKGSKPATSANLKSLSTKLSRMLNEPQRRIEEDLQLAHGHSRLNLIRRANDDSTRNPRQVRELIARKAELVRQTLAGREASPQESNDLGSSFAPRPGGVPPLQNVVEQTPSQGMGSGVSSLQSQPTASESSLESPKPSQQSPSKPLRTDERGAVLIPSREDLIQAGQNLYEAGIDFAAWAGRMVQQFGEAVREFLSEVWSSISGGQYLPQARERGSVNISPGTGPKPRKFTQSVQAAEGVMPEVKAQLTALDYDPISNAQTVASARSRIDAAGSMDSAVTQFMGNAANPDFQPTAVDYATGIELLGQLQSRGRHEDAAAIADFMSRAGTTQGQAIQALSLISRLTPAGIEAFASRQITRAARNDPKIAELIQNNQRLRAEIAAAKRTSATSAIVDNRAAIKAALPAGADPVATNIAIRETILQSPTPLAAQAATARILQDNGLSESAAIRISESITRDFLKTTTDSRATVLQDLFALAEKDRRLNKSTLGSLIRLNREGKLTDSRLHADMAKMLGIPAWTSEHSAKVQRLINERERATDPRVKLVKAAEALDVIYREAMPPGILDKVDTYQTMAMLLNGLTQVRNLVGNISMAGVEIASDTVAQALDAGVGVGTGQRTRTGLDLSTRLTELGAGFQDIRAGYQFARAEGKGRRESFKEGVQTLIRLGRIYSSGKYDSQELTRYTGPVFNNPVMQTLENTLGAALSLADRGFYESAFKASLQNRMRTAAQNGTPMLAPDPDMIEQARMDAARAIYQDENIASKGFSGLRRVLNANKRWGLGSMVLKFTQVPGSILVRGLEFTPINTIRVLYETVAPLLPRTVGRYHIGKDFDQKAFTDAFARSLIGTGFLATGYWLAHLGILSGGMDSDDENERELAKAEGWGPYHINVSALQRAMVTGNFWTRQPRLKTDKVVKYDWLAPMSIGVAMGANMREGKDKILKEIQAGKRTSDFATTANWLLAAAGETAGVTVSAMNTVLEQPMLSNLSQLFIDAGHSDPISALVKTAADIPGTMIPTVVKQWARYEDNTVRETRDGYDGKLKFRQTVNELKAMLPGVSKTLPPRYDMEGNIVERFPNNGNTFFNVALNPAFVGYIKKSKLLSEMSNVYKATADGGVVPSRIKPKVSLENVEITLMPDEISALQKEYGMLSVAAAEKFVFSDPYYEKATWEQRAHALQKALTMAAKAAKYRVLQSRPDLYHRAKAEHIQRMESQRAANQQAQQDLAAVSQAMGQLQPGP